MQQVRPVCLSNFGVNLCMQLVGQLKQGRVAACTWSAPIKSCMQVMYWSLEALDSPHIENPALNHLERGESS